MKRGEKAHRRRGRKKSGKRRAGLWIGLAFAVLAVCAGAAASFLYLTGFGQKARIEIATGNHEIYEGDALPPLLVDVSSGTEDRNGRIRLDGGDKTTAADLGCLDPPFQLPCPHPPPPALQSAPSPARFHRKAKGARRAPGIVFHMGSIHRPTARAARAARLQAAAL